MSELRHDADETAPVHLKVTCMHMRHKLMYCDSRHDVPGMVDDSSTTRVFLCAKTWEGLGPDGRAVHPSACTRARACYCHGAPGAPSESGAPANLA